MHQRQGSIIMHKRSKAARKPVTAPGTTLDFIIESLRGYL